METGKRLLIGEDDASEAASMIAETREKDTYKTSACRMRCSAHNRALHTLREASIRSSEPYVDVWMVTVSVRMSENVDLPMRRRKRMVGAFGGRHSPAMFRNGLGGARWLDG